TTALTEEFTASIAAAAVWASSLAEICFLETNSARPSPSYREYSASFIVFDHATATSRFLRAFTYARVQVLLLNSRKPRREDNLRYSPPLRGGVDAPSKKWSGSFDRRGVVRKFITNV